MKVTAILLGVLTASILCDAAVPIAFPIGAPPAQDRDSAGKIAVSSEIKLAHPEVPRIPAKEVKQLIAKKADIVIIDTQPQITTICGIYLRLSIYHIFPRQILLTGN